MPSKREHTKSRRGCGQCKKRRIKCDEVAPRCGPCTKKGLECEYHELQDVPHQIELLTLASFPMTVDRESPPFAAELHPVAQSFSMQDLLLMHHFSLYTSRTIGALDEEEYHFIWQRRVPELASRHGFLMHAVLSHTAAHIATSDSTHTFKASRDHYSKALSLFTSSVDAVTPDRADAVFCFCILIMLITFNLEARHALQDGKDTFATGIVHSFGVIRTAVSMLLPLLDELREREIGSLLRHNFGGVPHPIPEDISMALDGLDTIIFTQQHSLQTSEVTALSDAIQDLRRFFTLVHPKPKTWAKILQWPISLSLDYLALLQHNSFPAMAIFCYWCVPVHYAPQRWDVGDWPKQVVLAVSRQLTDTIWAEATQWPLTEVSR